MFTSRQFSITDEEWNKIKEWDNIHECTYKSYGIKKYNGEINENLSITFFPTSIGEIVKIKCSCGQELWVR